MSQPALPPRGPDVDDGAHERPATSLLGAFVHDRYEVLEELGWGSLGHVYLARDHLRRDAAGVPDLVALKVVRRDRLSPRSLEYLRREFRALSRLAHENVARVFDLDVIPAGRGGQPALLFFTLELLRGPTLVEACQALGWSASLELFVQALRALAYVHARGLLHMDLKPQNVVVTGDAERRRVKVIDFHLAQEMDDPAAGRSLRGTIAYMAPEVVRGEVPGPRADLYGFGAVLYHALCGSAPFAGLPTPMDVLRAHTREPPPPLAARGASVPPALEAIVLRLLAKDPAERFASANDVIRAINAGLGRDFALEVEGARTFGHGAFVGRAAEVERVLALAPGVRADARAPWLVVLGGEPGIGRTRLLGELRVRLQLESVPALCAAPEGPDDLACGPFRRLAGELLRRARRTTLLRQAAPDGLAVDPDLLARPAAAAALPPHVARVAALADLLREVAAEVPCALLVDDVQDADPATLELLLALASGPPLPGLLVVVAVRDAPGAGDGAQEPGEARARLRDLALAPGVLGLELGRLGRAATAELVTSMVAARTVTRAGPAAGAPGAAPFEDLVEQVWAVTGGNPRFVEETLRGLAEADALRARDGALVLTDGLAARLLDAPSVAALAARRVARLEDDPALLLGACACSPRPRALPFVAAAAALALPRAQAALRDLERRGLVERGPGPAPLLQPLLIEHAPLRAAAAEALGPARRRAIHDQAARLIEARHPVAAAPGGAAGDVGADRAEELLWHLERAERPADALAWAERAARAARARGEWARARGLYDRAVALAARPGAGASPGLALRHAEVLAATGDRPRALALVLPLVEPVARSAEALRVRGRLLKDEGDLPAAEAHLDRALTRAAELEAQGDVEAAGEAARALCERASVRLWRGAYAAARDDALAALAGLGAATDCAGGGAGDDPAAAPALDVLYHACRFLGDDAAATAWLRRALRLGPDEGDEATLHPDRVDAGRVPLLGDSAGAHVPRTVVEAALDRADREDELAALYRRRSDLLHGAGDLDGAAYALLNLAHLRAAGARWPEAHDGLRRARALFERGRCRLGQALVQLSQARALAETGAPDAARVEAVAAGALAEACGARWLVAQVELALVEVARARGDRAAARAALGEARARARALGNVPLLAEVALLSAEVELLAAPGAPGPDRDALTIAGAGLETFERAAPGARTAPQQVRALLVAADLAVAAPPGDDPQEVERRRQLAVGRAGRALEQARDRGLRELCWRAAAARSRARRALGDAPGELEDLVLALEVLRTIAGELDEPARVAYLAHAERSVVRERFAALRAARA